MSSDAELDSLYVRLESLLEHDVHPLIVRLGVAVESGDLPEVRFLIATHKDLRSFAKFAEVLQNEIPRISGVMDHQLVKPVSGLVLDLNDLASAVKTAIHALQDDRDHDLRRVVGRIQAEIENVRRDEDFIYSRLWSVRFGGKPSTTDAGLKLPYVSKRTISLGDGTSLVRVGHRRYDGDGPGLSKQPEKTIPVDVYVDTDDETVAQGVIDAAQRLAEALGYEGSLDERIHLGSIWRRARAMLKRGIGSEEFRDGRAKTRRALELIYLDTKQADVNSKQSEAVSGLIECLKDVSNACIRVGSLMLVKFAASDGFVILHRELTEEEMRAVDRFPEIQTNPRRAFEALTDAVLRIHEEEAQARSGTPQITS